ncbi:hypothetical protein BGZ61DRAFT_515908 [Ilyonectria robusta]|uniref:uncharacterized protein n=1 Tax=Ilyonectria robusta TaxID=1079257 RepID=UPI001E8EDA41|nr:uncharacterized protein BGZ61DRAFT_515908 [Ilyonectria robusta]KAH8721594.1 hypothetical protein BGZ61DRAFT_515908 [Ilyonectria robusta]
MPDRGAFDVEPNTDPYPSRDRAFRHDFASQVAKINPQLEYVGLRNAAKAYHFKKWTRHCPEQYQDFRSRARSEGYNPTAGFVELRGNRAIYHYNHPEDSRNLVVPPVRTYIAEPLEFPPSTPRPRHGRTESPAPTAQSSVRRQTQIEIPDSDDELSNMAPPTTARDERGRYTSATTANEVHPALTRMDGLRMPNSNDIAGTCTGVAELYSILTEAIERQTILRAAGGASRAKKFLEVVYTKFPKKTAPVTPVLGTHLHGTPSTGNRTIRPIPIIFPSLNDEQPSTDQEDPFTTPSNKRASAMLKRLQNRAAKAQRVTKTDTSSGLKISVPVPTYPFVIL